MTKQEKAALKGIVLAHLPPESKGARAKTCSPICGLLDVLDYLKVKLPYKLRSSA